MNYFKTGLLMAAMTVILVMVGHFIDAGVGSNMFTVIFLFIALGINFVSYWYSDKIVLSLYRAKPLSKNQAPELHDIIERLSQRAGMPKPRLYIAPMDVPNAFATGRNPENAVVCVTSGIMRLLPRRELEGVLAHELSHVKHYDTLVMSVTAAIAGIISLVGRIAFWTALLGGGGRADDDNVLGHLFMIIIAPLMAVMIQLAVSRTREYKADEQGGRLCGDPDALADALERMEAYAKRSKQKPVPATSHLFIVNPAAGKKSLLELFSTHPSTAKRVRKLRELAAGLNTAY